MDGSIHLSPSHMKRNLQHLCDDDLVAFEMGLLRRGLVGIRRARTEQSVEMWRRRRHHSVPGHELSKLCPRLRAAVLGGIQAQINFY